MPVLDGVASILVGLLLGAVAWFLGTESRSLLMGEGVAPETQRDICELAERDPSVLKVMNVLSTYQSPESAIVLLVIAFKQDLNTADINSAIERIRASIKAAYRYAEFVIIQPQKLSKPIDTTALESIK
jgi:divalent metal cation (Fe/Co/Zn/Cd) transporter